MKNESTKAEALFNAIVKYPAEKIFMSCCGMISRRQSTQMKSKRLFADLVFILSDLKFVVKLIKFISPQNNCVINLVGVVMQFILYECSVKKAERGDE